MDLAPRQCGISLRLELELAVKAEVNDPEFRRRKHGSRRTADDGCKGPLCRKARNDHYRERMRKVRDATKPRPVYKPTLQDAILIQLQRNYEAARLPNGNNF